MNVTEIIDCMYIYELTTVKGVLQQFSHPHVGYHHRRLRLPLGVLGVDDELVLVPWLQLRKAENRRDAQNPENWPRPLALVT